MESLARTYFALPFQRLDEPVELSVHRLRFLLIRILLVASLPTRVAVLLAHHASDPSLGATHGNADRVLQTSGRDFRELDHHQPDRLRDLRLQSRAAGYYTLFIAAGEMFYHWNIKTPRWFGYIFQRPESHRVHHQFRHHTNNFSDLPIWDMLFGTFQNPLQFRGRCGYEDWREDRFDDMIALRDVHAPEVVKSMPLHFLPTCIGCSKRWACSMANNVAS